MKPQSGTPDVTVDEHRAPLTASDPPEVEAKAGGIIRVSRTRAVTAECRGCPMRFDNTGSAWSHSRSSRHRVDCSYATTFTFAPIEILAAVLA